MARARSGRGDRARISTSLGEFWADLTLGAIFLITAAVLVYYVEIPQSTLLFATNLATLLFVENILFFLLIGFDLVLALIWLIFQVSDFFPVGNGEYREKILFLPRDTIIILNRYSLFYVCMLSWYLVFLTATGSSYFLQVLWTVLLWIGLPYVAFFLIQQFNKKKIEEIFRGEKSTGGKRSARKMHAFWVRRIAFYIPAIFLVFIFEPAVGQQWLWGYVAAVLLITSGSIRFVIWLLWLIRYHTWDVGRLRQQYGYLRAQKPNKVWVPLLVNVIAATIVGLFAVVSPMLETGYEKLQYPADDVCWRRSLDLNKPSEENKPLSIFLVSDNHYREMDGQPSGVQIHMIDHLVPGAMRPIELDLLSGITMRGFAEEYHQRRGSSKMLWAHLGDFGDLGCKSEFSRIGEVLDHFEAKDKCGGKGCLAGFLTGNHDNLYLGNFSWFNEWAEVCRENDEEFDEGEDQSAYKRMSNDELKKLYAKAFAKHYSSDGSVDSDGGYHARITDIGTLSIAGNERRVRGIFLDTADYSSSRDNIDISKGHVSEEQTDWVNSEVRNKKAGDLHILFMHHPYRDLVEDSRKRVKEIAIELEYSLLAVVAGHTHFAAARKCGMPFEDYCVPEFIVGSTTDPPQEAAMLSVEQGEDESEANLVFRTIQLFFRVPGQENTDDSGKKSESVHECWEAFEYYSHHEDCQRLLFNLAQVGHNPTGESDTEHIKIQQDTRKAALLKCLFGKDEGGRFDGNTEGDYRVVKGAKAVDAIDDLYKNGSVRDKRRMLCLGFFASVLQNNQNKTLEMAFERSIHERKKDEDVDCCRRSPFNEFETEIRVKIPRLPAKPVEGADAVHVAKVVSKKEEGKKAKEVPDPKWDLSFYKHRQNARMGEKTERTFVFGATPVKKEDEELYNYMKKPMSDIHSRLIKCSGKVAAGGTGVRDAKVEITIIADKKYGGIVESSQILGGADSSAKQDLSSCVQENVRDLKLEKLPGDGRIKVVYPMPKSSPVKGYPEPAPKEQSPQVQLKDWRQIRKK